MPADLDQFGSEYSHGAVIGGKGLVKLGHMAPNARRFLNQVNLKTSSSKIERGLDTADPSANNHYVSKITVRETFTKLFDLFFFHFLTSLSGFFVFLNRVHPKIGDFRMDLSAINSQKINCSKSILLKAEC
jgi:hypothetical protein